jgi:antitoxin CptB
MDDRRKRLMYQANHRGMMETDALVGGYAAKALAGMDDSELVEFERILDENDNDLLNWLLEREAIPDRIDGPMMQNLINYKKSL